MTHDEKLQWMESWAQRNGLQLVLNGECGFGRECVGVATGEIYPDYEWCDEETWDRLDNNGDVWTPKDAYHKHPCVAVLGRGVYAEEQLYEWLKWFDANGFAVEAGEQPLEKGLDLQMKQLYRLMGEDKYARLVKKETK